MRKNETIFCIKDYLNIKVGESVIISSIAQCNNDLKLISFSKDGIDYINGTAIYSNWFSEFFVTQSQKRKQKLKILNNEVN